MGILSVVLLAAAAFFLLGENTSQSSIPTASEVAALAKFGYAISSDEIDLNAATTNFIAKGLRAVQSHDPLAVFDATNSYNDSLEKLKRQIQQASLPNTRSVASNFYAKKAITGLERRLEAQYRLNLILVSAADRGEVTQHLFGNVQAKTAKIGARRMPRVQRNAPKPGSSRCAACGPLAIPMRIRPIGLIP